LNAVSSSYPPNRTVFAPSFMGDPFECIGYFAWKFWGSEMMG
jgi:hypothetical protein